MTAILEAPAQLRLHLAPPENPQPGRWRPDLQGLRAVAVLLVVLYHAGVPGLPGGYVGVDAFFVLSGFLITGQLTRRQPRLLDFYARRARRLLPPAAVVIVATVLVARLVSPVTQLTSVGTDALFSAFYAVNYHLASAGVDYLHADAAPSPLQHLWSLAVEEQFYLVWPLLVLTCTVFGRRSRTMLTSVVLLGLIAGSLWASIDLTSRAPSLGYFSLQSRAWEFGVGGLVALGAPALARLGKRTSALLAAVGLAGLVASALLFDAHTPFPGPAALLPVLATAAVVAAGCRPQIGVVERLLLGRGVAQVLGRLSYTWYLWHWPAVVLMPRVFGMSFSWPRNLEMSVLALWLAFLTTAALEAPLRKRALRVGRWLATGAGLSVVAAATAMLLVITLPSVSGHGAAVVLVSRSTPADASYVQQVRELVTEGAHVTAAPSNLTPSVLNAAADLPASSKQHSDCHADVLVITQGPCAYGDPAGTRTVVLFGDSHAQQWLPAFDLAGKREGWKVVSWTKAACPIAQLAIRNTQLNRVYTECTAWRTATTARIAALHPALVVVSQSDTLVGTSQTDTSWADRTLTTLKALRAKGTQVEYLLDTTYPKADVPSCVADHLADVRPCDLTVTASTGQRRKVVAAAVRSAGFPVQDPTPWTCAAGTCPVIVDGMLVYRDDSHLTATYSAWLAPMEQRLLRAVSRQQVDDRTAAGRS